MNEKQLTRVIGHLAEEIVPADVDLWPAIQAHFEMSKKLSSKGDLSMNTFFARKWRMVTAILMALLVFAVFLFTTPQGRALAQEILSFFTRAESDTVPIPPQELTPFTETTTPNPGFVVDKSILDVEQQAGYDVLVPTWIPEALTFDGASLEPEHNIVRLFYQTMQTKVLSLREEPFKTNDDCTLCGWVGSSAMIETVQIGKDPGEFVEGVWKLIDGNYVWESDPYMKTLRWQANGIAFELQYMGPPERVTKGDMLAVAESLK